MEEGCSFATNSFLGVSNIVVSFSKPGFIPSFNNVRNSLMFCGLSLHRGCIAPCMAFLINGLIFVGNAGSPSSFTSLASGGCWLVNK